MNSCCVIGLKVQALLRDPSKLPKEYEGKISVVQGDVLVLDDVKKTLEGQDAVIVVLGTRNSLSKLIIIVSTNNLNYNVLVMSITC